MDHTGHIEHVNDDICLATGIDSSTRKKIKKFQKRYHRENISNNTSNIFEFNAASEMKWYFKFTIPSGIYAGQIHIVEMSLIYGRSPDIYVYPSNAPNCTFMTPVWHPNVGEKGTICLDVLKDNWSPSMYTSAIISSILLLLENPNTSSPQNTIAASQFDNDINKYMADTITMYDYDLAPDDIRAMFQHGD